MAGSRPGEKATKTSRRHDPGRRDRIIDACLDVIAREGVTGTSHRRVAAEAGVPLGSMTYYFAGMGDLLHEAFARFARAASDDLGRRMAQAADLDAARRVVAEHIIDVSGRELVLSQELYTLAARDRRYRGITGAWMERSREALERHFDPQTARMLDALVEGLTIHRALDRDARDPREVETAIARVTGG